MCLEYTPPEFRWEGLRDKQPRLAHYMSQGIIPAKAVCLACGYGSMPLAALPPTASLAQAVGDLLQAGDPSLCLRVRREQVGQL